MTNSKWDGVECFAETCTQPVIASWLCNKHYQRVRLHNSLEPTTNLLPKHLRGTVEGFMSRVTVDPSGCWLWSGGLNSGGYGSYYLTEFKRAIGAHRAAYFLFRGGLQDSLEVDHICHVRHCVNPDHLRLTTSGQNNENSVGSRNPCSGQRNVRLTVSGRFQARIKKNGKEYTFPPTSSLSQAVAQAKELRMKHFTHNTFERTV